MAYTLEHDPIDGGHLIAITGELDIAATPELSTVMLMAARSPGPLVVLDLGGVEFIDSTALGTLLNAGNEVEASGKRLRVVSRGGPVRKLLELTNLTNRFPLCPTPDVPCATPKSARSRFWTSPPATFSALCTRCRGRARRRPGAFTRIT